MNHTIALFLKFGSKEHMLDLYRNGTIYFNTIQYFRLIEDEELRGDKYEGASQIINSLPGSFHIPSLNHTVNYLSVHLKQSYEIIQGNLFCLYCASSCGFPNPNDFKIDERIERFGTHCLIIKDCKYFMDQMEKTLTANGYKFHHGFVSYYDRYKKNGKVHLFEKPNEYEYQKEFRFYIENDIIEPIRISIGSLKHCAELFETKDAMKLEIKSEV